MPVDSGFQRAGSPPVDNSYLRQMGEIGSSRYLSRAGTASSTVMPIRLISGEMEKDFDILILLLPLPFYCRNCGGLMRDPGTAYGFFVHQLQILYIHQGTENAHLDI